MPHCEKISAERIAQKGLRHTIVVQCRNKSNKTPFLFWKSGNTSLPRFPSAYERGTRGSSYPGPERWR